MSFGISNSEFICVFVYCLYVSPVIVIEKMRECLGVKRVINPYIEMRESLGASTLFYLVLILLFILL